VAVGVVTIILPVVAPVGTVVVISVSETTLKAAATPWNVTLLVPVRPFPRMITFVPTLPTDGVVFTNAGKPNEKLKNVPLV
jgi:hypothetical protein